ncbi:hypothetical protein SLS63_010117 [Diaporthe eres]|uniref:Uncharacterized protein n=1 Tax=Diaporthe eres TaxID=83184 RepID=A0ABR1NXS9_DIAER
MSSPSAQPTEAKQSNQPDWTARLAELKLELERRRRERVRLQAATAQPADMNSSEDMSGQRKQQKQPTSDGVEAVQTKTSTLAQAQSIPGLSHQMPNDRDTHKGTSKSKISSDLNAPGQLNANYKVHGSGKITEKLMEKLPSSTPSKTTGKDANDAAMTVNEVGPNLKAPPGTEVHAPAKIQKKTDNCARGKAQQGADSTASEEALASRIGTKSKVDPKEKSSTLSATEEGEIESKPSAPARRIPVQESTPQPASRKRTPPTRAPTATTIVPTEPRAERNSSRSSEAKPVAKYREAQGDTAPAHPSASRSDNKHRHGRRSLHDRQGRQEEDDNHITWKAHKAAPPPFPHHVYARPSREQRPRSPSPAASRPIEHHGQEVQSFDFQDPDLRDWLRLTGWDSYRYRQGELARLRRQEEIDRESRELKEQGEREKAWLKEGFAEGSKANHPSGAGPRPLLLPPAPSQRAEDVKPAEYSMLGPYTVTGGIKRERGEESDGDVDGGFSTKYYRTNRNHRGSRASYHGYHHRGREDLREWQTREDRRRSGRLSPPRGFPDSPPPRSLTKRHPRQRFPSPAGHPLPRDEFDAQRAIDRYVTRDRPPPRHRSPRTSSSPPYGRGYKPSRFHDSEYRRRGGPPN